MENRLGPKMSSGTISTELKKDDRSEISIASILLSNSIESTVNAHVTVCSEIGYGEMNKTDR